MGAIPVKKVRETQRAFNKEFIQVRAWEWGTLAIVRPEAGQAAARQGRKPATGRPEAGRSSGWVRPLVPCQ